MFDDIDRFQRIAIITDGGGAMINTMAMLKLEIETAVDGLMPAQSFNLLFSGAGKPEQMSRELLAASPASKRKAATFLEGYTASGVCDPISAIEAAFKEKAKVIYLIGNGDFPDNDAVLKKVRELNKDAGARIYTIAYIDSVEGQDAFIELCKKIAGENHGKYKRVDPEELLRRQR